MPKITTKKFLFFISKISLLLSLIIFPFAEPTLASCICGDGVCNSSCENSSNCPEDCGGGGGSCVCGDGYCNPSCENSSNCPADCGGGGACVCGDGVCNSSCENSSNCPEDCPPSCINECSYSGQRRCACSTQYQICGNYDSDPCLEWSSLINCPSGQVCQNGQCVTPPPTCTDECSYISQKERRCSSSRYLQERSCGNYDSDSCLEWSAWTTIQDCGTSGWTDDYRCSGNWVQRKYINRGCSNNQCYASEEWRNYEDCAAQGKICQNGQCVTTCQNECSYSGQIEKGCSGNYVQKRTCGNYDSDPCLEWSSWSNLENCGESGWSNEYQCSWSRYLQRKWINRGCSNAQCFATPEWRTIQDCGTDSWTENYRCSGNWVQREKIKKGCSENSCYSFSQWENWRDCSAEGKICQNGQCVIPPCECTPWSGWENRGCGQGGCPATQMWQVRTRSCNPAGCAPESETKCVDHQSCQPNDPVSGTLNSSCTSACLGANITFTISAQDDQGVEKVCLNEDCQSCSWQSSCTKTWQITKNTPGSYTFSGRVYGKKPDGSGESASTNPASITVEFRDCNRPPIANAGPDKEVLETLSILLEGSGSDPDGDPITFGWTCTGGSLSHSNIAQPTFTAPTVSTDTSFACTLTVTDSKGLSASDSMNVLVKNQTLFVTLEAIPSSGSAPLNDVDLKATVSGTAIGTINYKFDCTSDGGWEYVFSGTSENPKVVTDACDYPTGGTYNAKVYVERGAAESAWAQATILVSSPWPVVDIKANGSDGPITISHNSSATLTWTSSNTTSCYASGDWSGSKPTSGSESTGNLTSTKTYTIFCSGPGGSASDTVTIYVSTPTLFVSLSANPSSGCAPLTNVSLTADVSGTAGGDISYFFDCTSDGTWEKIYTTSATSYTASNLCNFSSTGNYLAKVRVVRENQSAENTTQINVYSCYLPYYPTPTVDIKANGSDGPITISHNTSATLTWTSSNTTSCYASGDWSGSKPTSGSESTGNLTSTKTYNIFCSGPGGTDSDSVTIYVRAVGTLSLRKLAQNISKGTASANTIYAGPGDLITFTIYVKAGDTPVTNVTVRDILPEKIRYRGNLKIDGVVSSGDILAGLNIGDLSAYQRKTITFDAELFLAEYFPFGDTRLTNSATASSGTIFASDTSTIIVQKRAVAGITIPTGLTNNFFFDSFFLPLAMTLLVVWIFKARIINFEKWLEERKRQYQEYKAQKLLQLKIAQIKAKERLRT